MLLELETVSFTQMCCKLSANWAYLKTASEGCIRPRAPVQTFGHWRQMWLRYCLMLYEEND